MNQNKKHNKNQNKKLLRRTHRKLRDSFKDSNVVLKDHKNPKKYSEIFHEYMTPIINEVIHDEQLLTKTLDWGQLVWNKAVAGNFPDNPRSMEIESVFLLFKATFHDKALISEFLDRKKEMFNNDNFFIVKQTSLLDTDGRLSISVAVLPIEQ